MQILISPAIAKGDYIAEVYIGGTPHSIIFNGRTSVVDVFKELDAAILRRQTKGK